MYLHRIIVSALVATLLCGCGGAKPVVSTVVVDDKPKTAVETSDALADVLPDTEVEDALFKRAEKGVAEEKADDEHAKHEEKRLKRLRKQAQEAHNLEGEGAIVLELGNFCRHNKRIHDALRHYEAAEEIGRQMPDDGGLRAHAMAMMGEMHMRLFKYKKAIENFDEAEKIVKMPNKFMESPAKMELRKVWALHRAGKDDDAKAVLVRAKELALKEGKQSAAYHVALAVDGGFAVEAKDKATAEKMTREFDRLPEPNMKDAEFGQNYLKACAKSSRHEGQLDAEDYFEDKGNYFRSIIKQIRREARKASQREQSS